ncbi:sensor histidine kinase [Bacillus carboniphilus]|uniref:Sensor histidine kinase n=1 Tax=Bacillus carboniphilus TaxID=86663 RepID=A0ABY9JST1_9BACI|nr:sensor histidine kinase [Bacillus carboniphilus]WLR42460.1 sensor histidine kinase [Bacillus carboniphilus]
MNLIQRYLFIMFTIIFVITIVVGVSFYKVFLPDHFLVLWERKVFTLPFIVFLFLMIMIVGFVFSIPIMFHLKNELRNVDFSLEKLHHGSYKKHEKYSVIPEIKRIQLKLDDFQSYVMEQTKRSQKLVNEMVEIQEKRVQKVVEEERQRLARELHDSVSQQLFAASMLMSALNESNPGDNQKQMKMVEKMIHQSQLEMRALLLHLRPVALKGKSLSEGVEELLNELKQKVTISIEWKVENVEIDLGIEDHLFRILQEAVSNTLRHAQAQSLDVFLMERSGVLILKVIDDGVGFDVQEQKTSSYGLGNIHERALEIGGSFKIVSLLGKGTTVEVKVPIFSKKEGSEK